MSDKTGNSFAIKTYNFVKSFFVVAGWTTVSRVSGVVREMIFANIFGASAFSDVYAFAVKLPNFFRRFFAEGALNAVLVPKFSGLLFNENEEKFRQFANKMFSFLIVFLIFFVLLFEIGMPFVVKVIAPGFSKNREMYVNIIHFARIMFPYIFLISLVAFMSGILNSLHHFSWAAAISVVLNVSMIIVLVVGKVFEEFLGQYFILSLLSWSVLFGGILQCLILWIDCRKNGVKLGFVKYFWDENVKVVLKASIPGMIGASFMQINIFVDMAFGSLLPVGSVSYLNYSDRINQLPLSLFGVAMGVTLLPSLSKFWSKNDKESAYKSQSIAIIFGLLLAIPAAVGIFILAEKIISLLYGHGKFDSYAVRQTMLALKAFVCGLPAYVLTKVFSTVFFANKDTKTPVINAIICVFINGVLNYTLKDYFAHVGIAMATSISALVNTVLGLIVLYRRRLIVIQKQLLNDIAKILVASTIMGVAVFFVSTYFPLTNVLLKQITGTIVPIVVGLLVYGLCILVLRLNLRNVS